MAYGLLVQGGNDILQIDSEGSFVGLQASIQGSGSSISGIIDTDVIFMRRQTNAANIVCDVNLTSGGANFSNALTDTAITVEYLVLRRSVSVSTTGTYGLKVWNSGNNVAFDSRGFTNNGLTVIDFAPAGTLTPGSVITNDRSLYIEMSTFKNHNANYWLAVSSSASGYTFAANFSFGPTNGIDIAIASTFS